MNDWRCAYRGPIEEEALWRTGGGSTMWSGACGPVVRSHNYGICRRVLCLCPLVTSPYIHLSLHIQGGGSEANGQNGQTAKMENLGPGPAAGTCRPRLSPHLAAFPQGELLPNRARPPPPRSSQIRAGPVQVAGCSKIGRLLEK